MGERRRVARVLTSGRCVTLDGRPQSPTGGPCVPRPPLARSTPEPPARASDALRRQRL